jgi:predicted transcriptional regulator
MRYLALFGSVLAFVAAGCGGDGGEAGGLTREEFVSELDQICADFDAVQEEIGEPESLEDVAELGPEIESEFDAAIQRVRDLGEPPEEIADDVDRFLDLAEEQQAVIGDFVAAAEDADLERVQEIAEEAEELDEESDQLATELGAERCATD